MIKFIDEDKQSHLDILTAVRVNACRCFYMYSVQKNFSSKNTSNGPLLLQLDGLCAIPYTVMPWRGPKSKNSLLIPHNINPTNAMEQVSSLSDPSLGLFLTDNPCPTYVLARNRSVTSENLIFFKLKQFSPPFSNIAGPFRVTFALCCTCISCFRP